MGLSNRFTIRTEATKSLIELLNRTTIGTNGACYKHLDTEIRIKDADNPLFVSLERDEKVQGNITFCKRGQRWYVRYFAFSNQKQASKNVNRGQISNSVLKAQMADFFDEVLDGKHGEAPEAFYAYIDVNNERSKWMSEQFGFRTEAQVMTQTFSRTKFKSNTQVVELTNQVEIDFCLEKVEKKHSYFVKQHAKKEPFYVIKDESGEIIAFAKVTRANWIIKRLPGLLGGFFTKLLPFTPGIRKIIKPKDHRFLVPESVWVKDNSPQVLNALFEGILSIEKRNMLLWWVDRREPLWRESRNYVNWGIVHKMTPQTIVDVVVLRKNPLKLDELRQRPIFVAGWDLV